MTRLMPAHRRSSLGPTRYVARCVSRWRRIGRPCWNALPDGEHIGLCLECRAIVKRLLSSSVTAEFRP